MRLIPNPTDSWGPHFSFPNRQLPSVLTLCLSSWARNQTALILSKSSRPADPLHTPPPHHARNPSATTRSLLHATAAMPSCPYPCATAPPSLLSHARIALAPCHRTPVPCPCRRPCSPPPPLEVSPLILPLILLTLVTPHAFSWHLVASPA